jgi:hypothetical protein
MRCIVGYETSWVKPDRLPKNGKVCRFRERDRIRKSFAPPGDRYNRCQYSRREYSRRDCTRREYTRRAFNRRVQEEEGESRPGTEKTDA